MIELKNIDLSNVSIEEQQNKCLEEEVEFWEALAKWQLGADSKEHVIEELLDEFQSKLGFLYKRGITAQDVMDYYPNHLKKLETRPRD